MAGLLTNTKPLGLEQYRGRLCCSFSIRGLTAVLMFRGHYHHISVLVAKTFISFSAWGKQSSYMRTNTISLPLPPGGGGGAGVEDRGRLGDVRWLDANVCARCLKAKRRHCPNGFRPVSQQPLSAGAVRQNEFRPLALSRAAAAPSNILGVY